MQGGQGPFEELDPQFNGPGHEVKAGGRSSAPVSPTNSLVSQFATNAPRQGAPNILGDLEAGDWTHHDCGEDEVLSGETGQQQATQNSGVSSTNPTSQSTIDPGDHSLPCTVDI